MTASKASARMVFFLRPPLFSSPLPSRSSLSSLVFWASSARARVLAADDLSLDSSPSDRAG
jgi:hypothetical protein